MAALTDCNNVNVKLSGLDTFEHAYRLEMVAPIVQETIALFGAKRCLFGSNFPIEKLWTDCASLYGTFRQAMEHLPEAGQHNVLHKTAERPCQI